MRAAAKESSGEVDELKVPNPEQMDEQQAHRFLEGMMSDLGADSGYELRHEDFVMEMLQSGEPIRGREKMKEFQGAYPAPGHAAAPSGGEGGAVGGGGGSRLRWSSDPLRVRRGA
jgi:hypothetical protein